MARVIRQPFIELGNVAIQHGDNLVEHLIHGHDNARLERIRLLEFINQIGNDRVALQVRQVGHEGRHCHHVGRALHQLAAIAVVGVVIVRPVR